MKKYNNRKRILFLLILGLGIGFAYLSTQLNINGATNVLGSKWSVYFDNIVVSEGSMEAELPTIDTNKTTVDFGVTLANPGDYYEFTVDAINDGTINAMIDSIEMTELNADVSKYLDYKITYSNGEEIVENDLLMANKTKSYKILVVFKKDVTASDLSEENTSLNLSFTANYVQSTKKSSEFLDLVKNNALSDADINFSQIWPDKNIKGLYVRTGTENDENPIYYYRGGVENNNAMFAGYCWKIVRKTDTGGTKLIYNGEPRRVYENTQKVSGSSYINVVNDETFPFTFDDINKEWTNKNTTNYDNKATMSFSVKEAGDYFLNYKVSYDISSGWSRADIYKDGTKIIETEEFLNNEEGSIELYDLSPSTVISIDFTKYTNQVITDDGIVFSIEKGLGQSTLGCSNKTGETTQLSTKTKYNDSYNSLAYNGYYMYGTAYETQYQTQINTTTYLYGNSFTYSNGTYTLQETQTGVDNTHHYTCLSTTNSCSEIAYVFYYNPRMISGGYYIVLTGGKSVEDAISEMQTNTNNSSVKTVVDNWFANTFRTYFTNLGKNYNNYLEDTVWCNDRSMSDIYTDNGWKPNGDLTATLKYGANGRLDNGVPTLSCSNKNDSFTVNESSNGNGKLTYPVGLLTADELMLAGGYYATNYSYYLNSEQNWWAMSPSYYYTNTDWAYIYGLHLSGYLQFTQSGSQDIGVRPSISLNSNVKVAAGGDGTAITPYKFIVE